MPVIHIKRALAFVSFCICLLQPAQGQTNPNSGSDVDATIAKIVQARDLTSQYVVLAQKNFKSDSPEYNQAFKLYADAYSKYDAWNSYVASALQRGKAKSLNNNPAYDSVSAEASKSASAFTSYVDSKTPSESKAVITVLSSLADLGLKLWTGISKQLTDQRTAASKYFQDATKWQSWTEIQNPVPKGAGSPSNSAAPEKTPPTPAAAPPKS